MTISSLEDWDQNGFIQTSTPMPSEGQLEESDEELSFIELVPYVPEPEENLNQSSNRQNVVPTNVSFRPPPSPKENILTRGNIFTNCTFDLRLNLEDEDNDMISNAPSPPTQSTSPNDGVNRSIGQNSSEVELDTAERAAINEERIEPSEGIEMTVADEGQETRRKKRRGAEESKWQMNINKEKRAKGESYMGRKYERGTGKFKVVEKPAKVLRERCICKASWAKCKEVTDNKREEIHQEFWFCLGTRRKLW